MPGRQRILPVRRDYNRWVANQTLEDFALRFTAKSARRWSAPRVSQTAIGAISFLALEAIGGAITLSYGFTNVAAATLVVGVILFLTGLPISIYAARYGVDIDLLTRGAGFGYHRLDRHLADLRGLHLHPVRHRSLDHVDGAEPVLRGAVLARLRAERRRGHPARHLRHHLDQPLPAAGPSRCGSGSTSCRSASSCGTTGPRSWTGRTFPASAPRPAGSTCSSSAAPPR